MTTEISLTPKQFDLLQLAESRFFGNALPAAVHIGLHGGAYEAVGMKLKNLGLLDGDNSSLWHLTDAAKEYLTHAHRPEPDVQPENDAAQDAEQHMEDASVDAPETKSALAMESEPAEAGTAESRADDEVPAPKKRTIRDGTKLAQVISLLKQPEGATLTQIMDATGWKMHTTRAMLSRTIQKELGLTLVSEKATNTDRVYRVKI